MTTTVNKSKQTQNALGSSATADSKKGAGWAILNENYLMNNKFRDWDKLEEEEQEMEQENEIDQ